MGTDLHTPLGQDRPSGKTRRRRISRIFLSSLALTAIVLGLSFYAMQDDPALKRGAAASPEAAGASAPVEQAGLSAQEPSTGMSRSGPNSGARVERTLTEDGSVVTTYSPRPRDGSGPVIVETSRIGQDPRLAGTPNEDLLEDTPYGRLPVIGADGLRPMEQYARPWSGARGTRIAIVVGGLGLSQTGTQKAIQDLPDEVTLAFASTGNSLQRWMQLARQGGHEILMQIPMEPFGYSETGTDRSTLLTGVPAEENIGRLHEAMAKITGYTGITNHLGGRLLADAEALEPLLRDIAARGLLFLDDGSSARSVSATIAGAVELPHGFADLTLDDQLDENAILRKLDDLERIALRKGSAIGIASAFDESVKAIRQWTEEARTRGIEIVGVSALADDPTDR